VSPGRFQIRIRKSFIDDWPVLAELRDRVDALRGDAETVQLIEVYTGQDAEAVKRALQTGKGPILRLVELRGETRGRFDPNHPGTITLDTRMLRRWNEAPQDASRRDRVVGTCLHELVHWGRHKSRAPVHLCANAATQGICRRPGCGEICSREAGRAFEAAWAAQKTGHPPAPCDHECELLELEPIV